ncbi:hypothetical protein TorRG33x02_303530 [Trema orientale]|uniref:Uncharacterized protein n=1 Tax=Trema orientale TaxID=63057 RepID=A0A2P5BZC8_TREOI|nr:hypothetical protein TorRG33x02_303530 [Trema orientale]
MPRLIRGNPGGGGGGGSRQLNRRKSGGVALVSRASLSLSTALQAVPPPEMALSGQAESAGRARRRWRSSVACHRLKNKERERERESVCVCVLRLCEMKKG